MDGNRHNIDVGIHTRQISSFAPTCVEMQKLFPVANLAKPVRSTQFYVLHAYITYGHVGCGRRNSYVCLAHSMLISGDLRASSGSGW